MTTPDAASCRVDVWLWRARFFKTRALAARQVEDGRIRLTRTSGEETRLDKASRSVRPGDRLVFALGGRLVDVRVEALGARRGPPAEARTLYSAAEEPIARSSDEPGPAACPRSSDEGANGV